MSYAVNFPDEFGKRLSALAKRTHRQKDELAYQALQEFLEDQEDYYEAVKIQKRIDQGLEKTYSWEEVKKIAGLDPSSND